MRVGDTVTHFTNGISTGSGSFTGDVNQSSGLYIGAYWYDGGFLSGRYFPGYIDDLRITKGLARYTGNFTPQTAAFDYYDYPYWETDVLLMHFNGANNSTTFTDECGRAITRYGDAKISTTQSKFGGASGYFDGSGDYVQIEDSELFNFGSGDFTIEMWIYPTALPSSEYWWSLICQRTTNRINHSFSFYLAPTGIPEGFISNSGDGRSGTNAWVTGHAVSSNTWTHLAVTRASGTLRIFQNGILKNTNASANFSIYNSSATIKIGAFDEPPWSNSYFQGYMDEVRVTREYARYLTDFVPPTAPYTLPAPINLVESNQELFTYLGDTTQKNIVSDNTGYFRELTPYDDSGIWTVTGIVTIKSVPVQTTVYLFTKDDKRLIASTLSNSQGEYTFSGLKNQSYFVWAEDPTATYNPVTRLALNEVI